jgi:adenylylsulfate kinase-like enzyme
VIKVSNYLKSAIEKIYGKDDDFILLELTGRTGSGCSTVASILQSEQNVIKQSNEVI